MNISGAKGLLVNVTAGQNLAIGEFEAVGNAVKDYVSDDATVVIGTVIDQEMGDELRVSPSGGALAGNPTWVWSISISRRFCANRRIKNATRVIVRGRQRRTIALE